MELRIERFVEIVKQGYSLNHIYILLCMQKGTPISDIKEFPCGKALLQGMERKGLCTVGGSSLLPKGEKLLELYSSVTSMSAEAIKIANIDKGVIDNRRAVFDAWWAMFPGTDTFTYKNKKFVGSRALRTKKDDCKLLFDKILREGFTGEEMVTSLQYEVVQKKEDSIKRGENKLRFMQNSLTYLRQRTWEPYIELIRQQGPQIETEKSSASTIDI